MSLSQEAKDVSKEFAQLRDYGSIVANFNTHKHVKTGRVQKLTDYIIINEGGVYFIEVKLSSTQDKFSDDQLTVGAVLDYLSRRSTLVNYYIVTSLEDARKLKHYIIKRRYNGV